MKIPITYLIMVIVAGLTLGFLRQEYRETINTAEKEAKIQDARSIDNYCQGVKKITNLDFAMKRGIQHLDGKRYQQAAAVLDTGAKLNDDYRDSWFWAGYANLKDLEKRQKDISNNKQREILSRAKADLKQAYKIDPLYTETSKLLAVIAKSENNDKEMRLWYARYETVAGKKLSEITLK